MQTHHFFRMPPPPPLFFYRAHLFISRARRRAPTAPPHPPPLPPSAVHPPPPLPTSLVIIDLLSHQGTPDRGVFALVRDVLSEGLVAPASLFVFADLSALHTGLFAPPAATASRAERAVTNLRGPATYVRRGEKGVYLAALLAVDNEDWHPTTDLGPLLDFSLDAATASQCAVGPAAGLAALKAQLTDFVGRIVAPRIGGTRATVVLYTHGGFAICTTPTPTNPHCLGEYSVNGVTNTAEDAQNVRDLLEAPWLAENLVAPLARAAGECGAAGGARGHLLWIQSTCFAPPIMRSLAVSLGGGPLSVFGGPPAPLQPAATADPLRLVLLTHWPLLSSVQDLASLLCQTHGEVSMYEHVAPRLSALCARLRAAAGAKVAAAAALRAFPAQLLEALSIVDSSVGAMAIRFENKRSAAACVPWWGGAAAAGPAALLPPLPLRGAKPARVRREREKHVIVVWDPEEAAVKERAAPPLEALYAAAALEGARGGAAALGVDGSPSEVLSSSLLVAARALQQGHSMSGGAPPPGGIEARLLSAARVAWLATALVYAPEGAGGGVAAALAHKASVNLSVGLECHAAAVVAALAAEGGGGGEGAGCWGSGAPPPPAPPSSWTCAACSLSNEPSAPLCLACEAPNPAPPPHLPGQLPPPWAMCLPTARLVCATLLPLLHSLPLGTALVAHEKSLSEAALRLASARLLVEDAEEGAAAAAAAAVAAAAAEAARGSPASPSEPSSEAASSPLCAWVAQVALAPDLSPPQRKYSDVPLRFRRALVKAAMEVSAARWPGALCKMADLARFARCDGLPPQVGSPSGAQSGGNSGADACGWAASALGLARAVEGLVSLHSLGDSSIRSPVLRWLGLLRGGGMTLREFEARLDDDFVEGRTRMRLSRGVAGCAQTPQPHVAPVPLLGAENEEILRKAQRMGGVYAWGVGQEETL